MFVFFLAIGKGGLNQRGVLTLKLSRSHTYSGEGDTYSREDGSGPIDANTDFSKMDRYRPIIALGYF